MIETYRFRLYPNDEQKVLLAKHFGTVRFVYNWALNYNTEQYAQCKKHLGWLSICGSDEYHQLKKDNPWMRETNVQSMTHAIAHLDKAFQRFFRGKSGFPKFKSKYDNRQSFEVPEGLKIDFKHRKIQIPKFINRKACDNRLKFVLSKKVAKGKYGTATVSKNAAGQYFISFIVHTKEEYPEFNKSITKDNSLGIDFGMKHFLNYSTGEKVDSPEFFRHALDKLRREQRKLSKKQKGSKNKEKQRIKVARCHLKIVNQRQDFLHKLTTGLVKDSQFDVFCLETLNLQGMSKLWGRKVNDLSYYEFQRQLEYKCQKWGKKVIKIGRFEPSSQICSACGHRQKLGLNERTYRCPHCGAVLDRDTNAAMNIRNFALRDTIKNLSTGGTPGTNACGVGSSGCRDASRGNETADVEAGKLPRHIGESQSPSVTA